MVIDGTGFSARPFAGRRQYVAGMTQTGTRLREEGRVRLCFWFLVLALLSSKTKKQSLTYSPRSGLKKRLIDEGKIGPFPENDGPKDHSGLVIGLGWEFDGFLNAGPLPVGVGGSVGPIVYVGVDFHTGEVTSAFALEYTGQVGGGYGLGSFEGIVKVLSAPDVESVLGSPANNVGVSSPIGDLDIIWDDDGRSLGFEVGVGIGPEAHIHRGKGDSWWRQAE